MIGGWLFTAYESFVCDTILAVDTKLPLPYFEDSQNMVGVVFISIYVLQQQFLDIRVL